MNDKKILVIIDGNALLHRAWHGIPPLTATDGRIVNAVYGFTNVVEKILKDFNPHYFVVAWDLPKKTFRHKIYAEYKGNRKKKEPELYEQIPMIQEILDGYGIPSISVEGFEADDIIGTLAKVYGPQEDVKVQIITADMDLLQLVDKDVEIVGFVKGLSETKIYNRDAVKIKMGVYPEQVVDLKALMGDSSDNIPGVAGVGKKTAQLLIEEFGSIEGILEGLKNEKIPEKFAKKLRNQDDHIKLMQYLVTIVTDIDLPFKLEDSTISLPDVAKLLPLFRLYGFRKLISQYSVEDKKVQKTDTKNELKDGNISDIELNTEVTLFLEEKQEDLFGGNIAKIGVSDGKIVVVIDDPTLDDITNVKKILDSAKEVFGFDLKKIMHLIGIIKAPLFDIGVAAYLLSAGTRSFDYETVTHIYLGNTVSIAKKVSDRIQQSQKIVKIVKTGLENEEMTSLADEIEMPLIKVLYKMEKVGIKIDVEYLGKMSKDFDNKLNKLTEDIHKLSKKDFNINSPSQLAVVLFEDLELPTKGIKKTKTGYSTAASELDKLYDLHEIIPMIKSYRELAKLKSTYIDALPRLVEQDGRIHTTYNQTVAATGRLSSSDPNLQNIPTRTSIGNDIRKSFISRDGYTLVAIDYSQFELRIAAVLADDKSFLKSFKDGADIHKRIASEILEKPESEISKSERGAAKSINFGILYGMGSRHLAKSTGFNQKEAKAFIEKYFIMHPGIKDYIDNMKEFAHEQGYVETLFGRRRYLPEISSHMKMLVAAAERMAVNMPVQGTQADLIKKAMLEVQNWLENTDSDAIMMLQVHDELVFEVKTEKMDEIIPKIKEIMEGIWESDVPLVVDVEIGKNWGEIEDWR